MIEKRHVRMRAATVAYDDQGNQTILEHEANDYVPVDQLDTYVADARTRWASVTVGDTHNPGPAGDIEGE